jgi:DNA-binding LytR/AlgR family response regulator
MKLETLLPLTTFIRIHRSTIINTAFIQFIEDNFAKVNGVDLTIGATYKESVLQRLA